jgi:hypothetical protein
MKVLFAFAVLTFVVPVLAQTLSAGGEKITSGPQVGEIARPKPFYPLNLNGPTPNEKQCLVSRFGNNPVAMIFARDPADENLLSLIKKLDVETVKNADKNMACFAVFCIDTEGLADKAKILARTQNLEKCVLAIDGPMGPDAYKIATDADVTVILYTKSKVLANHTFRKGAFTAADVDRILSDVSKILK